MIAWSYGGGWQTAAIAVLIREGVLPKPDLSVMADTGREKRTTWEYLHTVIQPYLDPIGVKVEIAPHSLATVDLYSHQGKLLVPAYDAHEGRFPAYCSGEWKREVVNRWLRGRGVESCDLWIGYSIDEIRRVSQQDRNQWCRHQYPLIDRMINRAMCRSLVLGAGLPMPQKSRCWGCPHQSDEEWQEVKNDPEDWAKAVELDREIRENDERDGLFLYSGRVPLELADFSKDAGINAPSRPCETGYCWT